MRETVMVQLEGERDWRWWTPGQTAPAQHGDGKALARFLRGRSPLVLLDGRAVLAASAAIAATRAAEISRALPYAVEEQLLDDIEHCHILHGERAEDGRVPFVAFATALVDAVRDRLAAAGIAGAQLLPEYLALPLAAGGWTVLVTGARVVVRTAPCGGWALEQEAALDLLERELALHDEAPAVAIHSEDAAVGADFVRALEQRVQGAVSPAQDSRWTDLAVVPERSLAPFMLTVTTRRGNDARYLGAAAVCVLLALLAHSGGLWLEAVRVEGAAQQLRALSEAKFRAAFPDVQRIVDPAVQARQALEQLRRAGQAIDPFFNLLAVGGAKLHDGAVELQAIDYQNGALELEVRAKSTNAVDDYRLALEAAPDITVRQLLVQPQETGVLGRLRLSAVTAERP